VSVVVPLVIWPPPPVPDHILAALKVAKDALCERDGLDIMVQLSVAVPGTHSRVLSFDGPPPFLSDTAKLVDWTDPAELLYWVEWALDESKPVELGFTKAQWLAMVMPGAKEILPEPVGNPITDELYANLPY
jgi:hypothetical protein